MDVIEELTQDLEGLDPTSPEYEDIARTIDVVDGIAYAIEEGFVTAEEAEDGEIHFFPGS